MLKINLYLEGERKTFQTDFISGKKFRRALELDDKRNKYVKQNLDSESMDLVDSQELLDELYLFISQVFDNQFTTEQYEEGTDARRIINQSWAIVHSIISQTLEEIPTDSDSKKNK
ncbi:phage tail assembly chaperone G [Thermoactinomyces sp. DSM 45892]|uniref:phage tail assembly chaperone G n=1 Tax=Thermoactinomyces sp. DSM 45892 TaxID=1882753 RepID=UPI0008950E9C|nr:hypothetical protein [Thermoactinomyces sp. DSM 45892]SDY69554.1 hypothetical protein SAMN05444416_107100 [Thermoactinomyces sp. DSM 45892]